MEASCPVPNRISSQQLDILIQYMERYPRLALATARSREDMLQSRRMWEKIARTLNKLDENFTKTGHGWIRYWCCRKFNVRKRYANLRKCQLEKAYCPIRLDKYDEKIVKIITDKDGNLLPLNVTDEMVNFQANGGVPIFGTNILAGKPEDSLNTDADDYTAVSPEPVEVELKPFIQEDPIRIEEIKSLAEVNKKTSSDPGSDRFNAEDNRRIVEELRREMLEFELRRQKELFEIEKTQMKARHKLEIELLQLKKQLLIKELNS